MFKSLRPTQQGWEQQDTKLITRTLKPSLKCMEDAISYVIIIQDICPNILHYKAGSPGGTLQGSVID